MSAETSEQARVERRADHLLPEEEAVGSGDRLAQAREILADSDRRTDGPAGGPDPGLEHRTSEQTVTPPEPPD